MSTPAPAAAPTLAVTADKATYLVGDTITLNVVYADAQSSPHPLTVTVSGTDAAGAAVTATASVVVTENAPGPMTIAATDSFNDTFTVVSNDNKGLAVLSAVIGTPPAGA